jgi:hypothetical protein
MRTYQGQLERPARFAVVLGVVFALFGGLVQAQDSPVSDFELRRVFIPQQDLPVIGPEHVPVSLEELEKLLAERRRNSLASDLESVDSLQDAIYVGEVIGNELVSTASRFRFVRSNEEQASIPIAPCSLAISASELSAEELSRYATAGYRSITAEAVGSTVDGRLLLNMTESSEWWFSWSSYGQAEGDADQIRFQFDYPACIASRLLLKLPSNGRIVASNTVVTKIASPLDVLEGEWPGIVSDSLPKENWWLLELSGSTRVWFQIDRNGHEDSELFGNRVAREHIDYQIRPGVVEVQQTLGVEPRHWKARVAVVQLSPGLRVESVTINDKEVDWVANAANNAIQIRPSHDDLETQSRIELKVRGLAPYPLSSSATSLPIFDLAQHVSIDGSVSLSIPGNWMINELSFSGSPQYVRNETLGSDATRNWQWRWSGRPTEIVVDAWPIVEHGEVSSLSRITNEADGISCTSWVNIEPASALTSAVQMKIPSGWTLESIQSLDKRCTATVERLATQEINNFEISLSPPIQNAITIEIRSHATWPNVENESKNGERVFRGRKPFIFPDWKQQDDFWVEPIGRFKLEPNAELIESRISEEVVLETHRERLPRIGGVWLIRPNGEHLPDLKFAGEQTPYNTHLETRLKPGLNSFVAEYSLRCTPLAGGISSITVDLTRSQAAACQWRQKTLGQDGSEVWFPLETRFVSDKGAKTAEGKLHPGERVQAEILLKAPASQTIELLAKSEYSTRDAGGAIDIPLLVFPVAAQQSATLIADRRMLVEDVAGTNTLSPAGYTSFSAGIEGLKFTYDPIRVSQVKIRSRELQPASGWLSQVVSQTTYLGTGAQTLKISARLYAETAGPLTFRFPNSWQIRSARCDDRKLVVKTSPDFASSAVVWIPQFANDSAGCDLELTVDGPESVLEHKQRVEIPEWSVDCKIVSERRELWLPKSVSLRRFLTLDKWLSFPTWELNRVLPSVWWKSLSSTSTQLSADVSSSDASFELNPSFLENEAWLAWSSDGHPAIPGIVQPSENSFTLAIKQTEQSANWLRLFVGLTLALCLAAYRTSILAIGLLLTTLALLVVHPAVLPSFQQFALGWLLACCLRLSYSAMKFQTDADEHAWLSTSVNMSGKKTLRSIRQFRTRSNSLTHSAKVWLFILNSSTICLSTMMNELRVYGEPPTARNNERYDLILPIDDSGEIASTVAYIPEKLLQVLSGTKGADRKRNTISSIRNELNIASSESNLRETVWTSRIAISIEDPDQVFYWPLEAKNATLISFEVNGEMIALGSRLRWDEKVIAWMPTVVGETMLELKFSPRIQTEVDGAESLAVDLLPIAFSRLTINSHGADDLQTNVTGSKLNEPFGRKEIALGPIKRFTARWRSFNQDMRRLPVEVVSTTEIAMLGSEMLGKTQFKKLNDSVWPQQIDIECGESWRLLDRRMGEYLFSEVIPASTRYRKRYRFVRETGLESSQAGGGPLELYWVASQPTGSVVDALLLDVTPLRVTESFLHVMQSEDAEWEIDGLQSWEVAPSAKAFDWQTRRDVSVANYQRLSTHTIPFLKRIAQTEKPSAEVKTELQFDANQVTCRSVIQFANPVQLAPGTSIKLNSPQQISRVLLDNRETPFTVNDDLAKLTILPVAKQDRVEKVEIHATQRYAASSWETVPLQNFEDCDVTSHAIQARRLVGNQFQWTGVSTSSTDMKEEHLELPTENDENLKLYVPAWNWKSSIDDEVKREVLQGELAGTPNEMARGFWPKYRAQKSLEVHRGVACIEMTRQSRHWVCSVFGRVESSKQQCDGILLELPSSLLSQFESKQRSRQFKSPEVGRGLVFLLAEDSETPEDFEFSFSSIVSGVDDNSTISVPDIQWLGNVDWTTYICLPPSIAGQTARWTWSGARQEDQDALPDSLAHHDEHQLKEGLILKPTTKRPQIRLGRVANSQSTVRLSLVEHRVRSTRAVSDRLRSTFWLTPQGHSSVSIRFSEKLEFLAAECNGKTVQFRHEAKVLPEKESSVKVQLLSSSLPQKLLVYFKIREFADQAIDLPCIADTKATYALVNSDAELATNKSMASIDQEKWIGLESITAWDVVENAISIIAEIPLRERLQWWEDWQRTNVDAWRRTVFIDDRDLFEKILERRRAFCDRFQLPLIDVMGNRSKPIVSKEDGSRLHYYEIQSLTSEEVPDAMAFATNTERRPSIFWGIVGGLTLILVAIFLLVWNGILYQKGRELFLGFVNEHPWWLWCLLGIIMFVFFPSWWLGPAIISVALLLSLRGAWLTQYYRSRISG